MNKFTRLLLSVGIPLVIWFMPSNWLPLNTITLIEQRVIALFFLAALMWIFEPIPIFATSMLIIFLELATLSNKGFVWFRQAPPEILGQIQSSKEIMSTLASPIIVLFLGGFFLALAATKYRLDVNLARVILKPFGTRPANVMLGTMIISGVLSMFMSNTATTAMMLAIMSPIIAAFPAGDRGRTAFLISIPFAANIGGMGTPIGTPPNAVAMKYLTGDLQVSFSQWMIFSVPFVVIMLIVVWLVLLFFFRPQADHIRVEIKSSFLTNWKALTVYVTFALTILAWVTSDWHGMDSDVVGMLPIAVFLVTRIITADDLKKLSWEVLWLISGGIALGLVIDGSGLSRNLINSIPFDQMSPLLIIVLASLLTLLMASFMSHTATANLLLPVVAVLGVNLPALAGFGGARMLILVVTLTSSMAMALPISTPPNAMAYASGEFSSKDMARAGTVVSLIGLGCVFLLMFILKAVHFL